MRIDQPAEILIFRQEDPIFGNRQAYHPLIISPRLCLPDLQHIISGLKQGLTQRSVTALIREKSHAGGPQEAFLEMITVSSCAIVSAAKRMAA